MLELYSSHQGFVRVLGQATSRANLFFCYSLCLKAFVVKSCKQFTHVVLLYIVILNTSKVFARHRSDVVNHHSGLFVPNPPQSGNNDHLKKRLNLFILPECHIQMSQFLNPRERPPPPLFAVTFERRIKPPMNNTHWKAALSAKMSNGQHAQRFHNFPLIVMAALCHTHCS